MKSSTPSGSQPPTRIPSMTSRKPATKRATIASAAIPSATERPFSTRPTSGIMPMSNASPATACSLSIRKNLLNIPSARSLAIPASSATTRSRHARSSSLFPPGKRSPAQKVEGCASENLPPLSIDGEARGFVLETGTSVAPAPGQSLFMVLKRPCARDRPSPRKKPA